METQNEEATSCSGEGLLSDIQVVFMCESCRSILGDATNWVVASEALEAFTLNAVTENIQIGDVFRHSTQAHDAGSSYSLLTCATCKVELGRQYISTPPHLDHLRGNFTLHVAMVNSYQLGSANSKGVSKFKSQEPPLLLKVAERCMKLQHLIVSMNERLCNIEKCLRGEDEGASSAIQQG